MKKIRIFTTAYCGYCSAAKNVLSEKGLQFEAIDVSGDSATRQKASDKAGGFRTVPMIFVGETFVGGHSDLVAKIKSGEFQKLVND